MAQIFPKSFNLLHFAAGGAAAFGGLVVASLFWFYGSPEYTDVGYQPTQPIQFSHKTHAGDLGMDCRYCHNHVETSSVANVPPTQTCMNCHTLVLPESDLTAPLRDSWQTGIPIEWVRIHKVPDYAYFDHAVHIAAGVGCASCHGRVDNMEVVMLKETLSMKWCLDCHRNPDMHLRDLTKTTVTDMDWQPPEDQLAFAKKIREDKNINPRTDCSACHR